MAGDTSQFSLLRWVLLLCTFILISVLLYERASSRPPTALAVEGFLSHKETRFETLDVLLEQQLKAHPTYAVYVEDLKTGAWIGVREDTFYEARSLAKVFLLVAVLRDVEDGELSLNDTITILDIDQDRRFGMLSNASGQAYTVSSLLHYLIAHSDNTALNALARQMESDDYMEMFDLLNLELPTIMTIHITPRSYGNVLAAVYRAEPLAQPSSQYALSLLSRTAFTSQLPAGVPSDVVVAHKIAVDKAGGTYHDCGIVFASNPYVICVMSTNTTRENADQIISGISATTYEYLRAQ